MSLNQNENFWRLNWQLACCSLSLLFVLGSCDGGFLNPLDSEQQDLCKNFYGPESERDKNLCQVDNYQSSSTRWINRKGGSGESDSVFCEKLVWGCVVQNSRYRELYCEARSYFPCGVKEVDEDRSGMNIFAIVSIICLLLIAATIYFIYKCCKSQRVVPDKCIVPDFKDDPQANTERAMNGPNEPVSYPLSSHRGAQESASA